MLNFLTFVLSGWAILLSIPVSIFALEILVAFILENRERPTSIPSVPRPTTGILVPAHNEGRALLPTISDIHSQMCPNDRLLVVADNCSDDTAEIAAAAGAEVTVRTDPLNRGKGYALDWGIRHLSAAPPEVVIVVDADCRLKGGTLDFLSKTCVARQRPIQALNLMTAPPTSAINHQFAEFAWRVKNWMRPAGLSALNLPCHLLGTGMALPWQALRTVTVASGHITEDLQLGLDLTQAGMPPLFCPAAMVTSRFPISNEGAETQRQRWEHGHVRILFSVPHLLWTALARHNLALLVLTLDIAVPPLMLLAMLVTATAVVTGLVTIAGGAAVPLIISATSLFALAAAVFLAWLRHGRDVLPLASWKLLFPYLVRKLRLYAQIISHGLATNWIRTDRSE